MEIQKQNVQHLKVKFSSSIVKNFIKIFPSFRGASMIGSIIFRLVPFLDKEVYLELYNIRCYLDIKYKTQFAFLMKPFEPIESNLIPSILSKGDIFFDIGSNWGYYTFLSSPVVGDKGRVIAIEPNIKTFCKLMDMIRTSGLNNVLPFNLAISNISGRKVCISLPWYKVDTGGFIKSEEMNSFKSFVRTKNLDLLWFQLGCPKVKMAKIDTEGAEVLILEGGKQFFTKGLIHSALIEISNWGKRFGHKPMDIYIKMKEYGFNYIYNIIDNNFKQIEMPINESSVFLGNVLFSKKDLSAILGNK